MAAPLVALGLALSRTNTLAQSGVTAVELMSNTVSKIADAFGRAFRFAMEKAMEAFVFIKDFFNEKVMPIFQPFINFAITAFNTIKTALTTIVEGLLGLWDNLVSMMATLWDNTITPLWEFMTNFNPFEAMGNLWSKTINGMQSIWNNTISPLWERITNIDPFGALGRAWDRVMNGMKTVYDNTLGPVFNFLDGIMDSIISGLEKIVSSIGKIVSKGFNFVKGGLVKAGNMVSDVVTGGGGGGGGSPDTTGGGGGGGNMTFNMTFNLGGITDRTDKRALAREIAEIIQQETARAITGSTQSGRYG